MRLDVSFRSTKRGEYAYLGSRHAVKSGESQVIPYGDIPKTMGEKWQGDAEASPCVFNNCFGNASGLESGITGRAVTSDA